MQSWHPTKLSNATEPRTLLNADPIRQPTTVKSNISLVCTIESSSISLFQLIILRFQMKLQIISLFAILAHSEAGVSYPSISVSLYVSFLFFRRLILLPFHLVMLSLIQMPTSLLTLYLKIVRFQKFRRYL